MDPIQWRAYAHGYQFEAGSGLGGMNMGKPARWHLVGRSRRNVLALAQVEGARRVLPGSAASIGSAALCRRSGSADQNIDPVAPGNRE